MVTVQVLSKDGGILIYCLSLVVLSVLTMGSVP